MTAHTPGPYYKIADQSRGYFICADSKKGQIELARIYDHAEYQPRLPVAENATLFTAAPTLLEACRLAADALYNAFEPDNQSRTYNEVRAAIALAEGTQQLAKANP